MQAICSCHCSLCLLPRHSALSSTQHLFFSTPQTLFSLVFKAHFPLQSLFLPGCHNIMHIPIFYDLYPPFRAALSPSETLNRVPAQVLCWSPENLTAISPISPATRDAHVIQPGHWDISAKLLWNHCIIFWFLDTRRKCSWSSLFLSPGTQTWSLELQKLSCQHAGKAKRITEMAALTSWSAWTIPAATSLHTH